MINQKLLIIFTIVFAFVLAILAKGILGWIIAFLGIVLFLVYTNKISTKSKDTNDILLPNSFTNKCVNCGKQYNARAIKKTWSINGQMFFCSWECDLEWSRKRSSSFVQPKGTTNTGEQRNEDL